MDAWEDKNLYPHERVEDDAHNNYYRYNGASFGWLLLYAANKLRTDTVVDFLLAFSCGE
jgi:hypothetical protein